MFFENRNSKAEIEAIRNSQAIIEFNPDGFILDANAVFLKFMGYELSEIKGKHHSIFVDPAEAKEPAYKEFWAKLRNGDCDCKEYKRFAKDNKEVWIQASYNPVLNSRGQVKKIIKLATDITREKLVAAENNGIIKAISKTQAVVEFNIDGTVITANENFLDAVGYKLEEIKSQHHSIFVDQDYRNSEEYENFWQNLRQGDFESGIYKRYGKNRKEIWLQAAYNPILDLNGKPFKVIKFATDITQRALREAETRAQLEAIHRAQAVIEFELDGTIITANDLFLKVTGYTLQEIQGKHHSMFLAAAEKNDPSYNQFWSNLRSGKSDARVYKRIAKSGKEVWIQASYNPILDMNNKPFKVVKFATEITNVIKTADLAEETNQNIQHVAAATEEMLASILEISRNMALSQSETAASQLVSSMQSIEKIIELINSIARKVNLLALNATIEAARAGAAGKGFAVVAEEVKNLALQTANATEDIAREITSIQSVSNSVCESVKRVKDAASSVEEYITGVASAIEEQSTVTKDISHNTQSISSVVNDIATSIRDLSKINHE